MLVLVACGPCACGARGRALCGNRGASHVQAPPRTADEQAPVIDTCTPACPRSCLPITALRTQRPLVHAARFHETTGPFAWPRGKPLSTHRLLTAAAAPAAKAKQLYSELNAGVPPPPNKGMRKRDQLVYDEEKEISRSFRRSVFDFDYWANHRSTSRYFFHMVTLPNSRIIRSLGTPIAWVMGIATLVCAQHTLCQNGIIPAQFELGNLDMAPVSLTSFALSLLLVFRTNSSYGRFDEARKMWGLMLNRSRDIARQAVSFFPARDVQGNPNPHASATFVRWTSVFTIALKCHLRPNEDLRGEASKLLSEEELELLMSAEHKVHAAPPLRYLVCCCVPFLCPARIPLPPLMTTSRCRAGAAAAASHVAHHRDVGHQRHPAPPDAREHHDVRGHPWRLRAAAAHAHPCVVHAPHVALPPHLAHLPTPRPVRQARLGDRARRWLHCPPAPRCAPCN